MTGQRSGREGELRAAADAERSVLNDLFAVTAAESVVGRTRMADLAAQQDAAYRRLAAARWYSIVRPVNRYVPNAAASTFTCRATNSTAAAGTSPA